MTRTPADCSAAPLRLLLAEDEPLQRKIIEHLLTRVGYEVETVTSGADAFDRVLEGRFQILITDWDMPGMDGAALCRRIREAELPGYLYILVLTGHTAVADTVAGLEAGADDYLRKPADESELLARVKAGRRIVELERSLSAAHARVEQLSLTDALLGCYNRRYFNEQLPKEIERAARYGTALALILADLDHFKNINDRYGRIVGDEVLCAFTRRSASCLRQNDWIARYGGEEFAIVLPHTDFEGARRVAKKVCTECAASPFSSAAGLLEVTVSLGVATLTSGANTQIAVKELLARADTALYRSKNAGRNRVTADDHAE